jgi:ribosomal protein L17
LSLETTLAKAMALRLFIEIVITPPEKANQTEERLHFRGWAMGERWSSLNLFQLTMIHKGSRDGGQRSRKRIGGCG